VFLCNDFRTRVMELSWKFNYNFSRQVETNWLPASSWEDLRTEPASSLEDFRTGPADFPIVVINIIILRVHGILVRVVSQSFGCAFSIEVVFVTLLDRTRSFILFVEDISEVSLGRNTVSEVLMV